MLNFEEIDEALKTLFDFEDLDEALRPFYDFIHEEQTALERTPDE